ncbi:hypothetical protein AB0D57_42390 [Streptomyces sp. NPDC048275]|uniref:hypothetical protein n=1 Tax=Streptomyces sp. NPDC048275 TaxID=3155629 RepID=UPI00340A9A34
MNLTNAQLRATPGPKRLRHLRTLGITNALAVTPEALDDFFARFEPPADDEDATEYHGDIDAVYSMTQ